MISRFIGWVITIITAPLWWPVVLYLDKTYKWQDTVPKEDETNE
jgi:hypothetical protein